MKTRGIFKVAIIGCGRIAGSKDTPHVKGNVATHAQAFHRDARFTLAAVVDRRQKQTRYFTRVWKSASWYTSLKELLRREKLDVISLCTPNGLHAKQIEEILLVEKGPRIIFAEKPVCLTREELNRLIQLEKKSNCRVIVNHTRRFDPAHIRLSGLISQGSLGRFMGGACVYYGGWLNNGWHMVDTLRMLFGVEPIIASSNYGPKGRGADRCLDVTLLFSGVAVLINGFDELYYQISEMELRFAKGRVLIRDFGSDIVIEKVKVISLRERVLCPYPGSPLTGLDSPLLRAVNVIAHYLEKGAAVRINGVSLKDSAKTMEILWQAQELARKKDGK